MMRPLTEKQTKALEYIRDCTARNGVPPTLREVCHYMGYKAIGSAQDVVSALRKKGFLTTPDKRSARAFLLTEQGKRFGSGSVQSGLMDDEDTIRIPQLGSVPAGRPLESIEDVSGALAFSLSVLPTPRPSPEKLFALKADGDSMVGAGILSGDWLIVKKQDSVDVGQIVVALVDDEATVKRLGKDKGGFFLQPENSLFKSIYAKQKPFKVIGKVIALQRSFN